MAQARDINIPIAVLRERLSYDPETGVLTARNGPRAGKPVRAKGSHGYLVTGLMIGGQCRLLLAHRIAFALVHGRWPEAQIDHINGDRLDNRIANLREATDAENRQNSKQKLGKSGERGVYWNRALNKWHAQISVRGKQTYIGVFADLAEAREAYLVARRQLYPFQPEPRL